MNQLSAFFRTHKTVLIIIGAPILLILVSSWQLYRLPAAAKDVASIRATVVQLQNILREQGQDATLKKPDGKQYSVRTLLRKAQEEIQHLNAAQPWEVTVRRALAIGELLVSVFILLTGGLFLLRIRRMGKQALKSRADLLTTFRAGQLYLSWFLVAFATLLFLTVLAALLYELLGIIMKNGISSGSIDTLLSGVTAVLTVLFLGGRVVRNLAKASNAAFQPSPLVIMGRSISAQDAPQLWGFVKQIASSIQAEMPNNIVVGLNECFFVTESLVLLTSGKEVQPGRTLYLPLPYMAFMSKGETAAVIGHELAHFTGDDTEYSMHFAPIYSHAVNNLNAVYRAGNKEYEKLLIKPVLMLGEYFLISFHEAVQHWSRKRELAADMMGARAADREVAAAALLRVSVLSQRVEQALEVCWNEGGRTESGVLSTVRQLVAEHGLDDPRRFLEDQQAHPTDSHPTTKQRLEALGVPLSKKLVAYSKDMRGSSLLIDLGLEGDATDDIVDVNEALEAEFADAAESDHEENTELLEALAAEGTETISIYEDGIITIGTLLALSLFGILAPFFFNDMPAEMKWGGWIFGPVVAMAGIYFLIRRRSPILTMTRDGVIFANLRQPLPWTSIEDMNLRETRNSTIIMTLELEADSDAPDLSGNWRARYKKGKHQIVIGMLDLRDMTVEEFGDLFSTYWNGGVARAALQADDG